MTNDIILRPVRPNAGIESEYRKRLKKLIAEMQDSIVYWLTATYRNNEPKLAQDDLPASILQKTMDDLAKRWQASFDEGAKKLALWFANKTKSYADGSLTNILKESGFAVEFKMTPVMQDAYQAVIHEQVGLIRSIASEHLSDVQGLVMRSVQQGRNLKELTDALTERYGVTNRRAALIARDQNNKANATITRVRQQGLGIKQAVWVHSTAGKHPRESHVKAGRDKLTYDIDKGAYIDGEWIYPGELINCRCIARGVIKGFIT